MHSSNALHKKFEFAGLLCELTEILHEDINAMNCRYISNGLRFNKVYELINISDSNI